MGFQGVQPTGSCLGEVSRKYTLQCKPSKCPVYRRQPFGGFVLDMLGHGWVTVNPFQGDYQVFRRFPPATLAA